MSKIKAPFIISIAGKNPFAPENAGSRQKANLLHIIEHCLKNGTTVILKPIESNSLCGISPDFWSLDEASTISQEAFDKIGKS